MSFLPRGIKIPFKTVMVAGWALAALFYYLSLTVQDERLANLIAESFGASVGIVGLYTLTLLIIWIKGKING